MNPAVGEHARNSVATLRGPGRATAVKLKASARRRLDTAVRKMLPHSIIDREYYPPQAAVVTLAVRIATTIADDSRDVENIADGETAEMTAALAPIIADYRDGAAYYLRQGPAKRAALDGRRDELEELEKELASAAAFLTRVDSGLYESELLDDIRWAIVRAAQMFVGANAPATALRTRELARELTKRRRQRSAMPDGADETEPNFDDTGARSAQTRVCAQ